MTARDPIEVQADAGSAMATVPRLIDGTTIADLLGITPRTLRRMVHTGAFPAPLLIGSHSPRWRASDYNAYVAGLREAQEKRRRHR
jgi:predicted DNA-binding transcriptional regulator AlpA